ncbi:hypothetical protein RclHR1_33720003 [Rhizophagus clarus]|uniref:Uncharacterized protein n=1 Tax=Rhizophagus clarus TaxID=94130 RepID=A0A2Z6S3S9_9GLOM|nr:hypothetical protein RclHR1_33720003 [Rhizophagus clarus]GET04381.1 hypothetical protein RCL_jg7804.t1 [Rhizophagus clarus]
MKNDKCSYCHGYKKVSCNYCTDGKKNGRCCTDKNPCDDYHLYGYCICDKCSGGKVDCPTCDGSGEKPTIPGL